MEFVLDFALFFLKALTIVGAVVAIVVVIVSASRGSDSAHGLSIEKLNEKFSKNISGVSESVMDLFMMYHWPGNIRQLENILEHAFVLCRRNVITPRELPSDFMPGTAARPAGGDDEDGSAEIRAIREALEQTEYNKSEAARLLGISRRTLYRKLAQYEDPNSPGS